MPNNTLNDLRQVLSDIVQAFNAHNFLKVSENMSDDAVVTSIGPRANDPHARAMTFTAQTQPTATDAIRDEIDENAWFDLIGFPNYVIAPDQLHATISGAAHWKDNNGTDHINFVCQLVFDANKNQWLFQNLSVSS
jgi:hypothetical protein